MRTETLVADWISDGSVMVIGWIDVTRAPAARQGARMTTFRWAWTQRRLRGPITASPSGQPNQKVQPRRQHCAGGSSFMTLVNSLLLIQPLQGPKTDIFSRER